MVRVLITGANGFIGKSLNEQLTGYDVMAMDKYSLNLLSLDDIYSFFNLHGDFDVVINCATYDADNPFTGKKKEQVLEKNLTMFLNLFTFKCHYGKLINFGSCAEYGRENWHLRIKEDEIGIHFPQDAYGQSKYCINNIIQNYNDCVNLRLFSIYGEHLDSSYKLITNIIKYKSVVKHNKYADYVFIDDLAKIVKWFIENECKYRDYNISTGIYTESARIREIITGEEVFREPIESMCTGDNSRLLDECPIKFTPIEEGIKLTTERIHANNL